MIRYVLIGLLALSIDGAVLEGRPKEANCDDFPQEFIDDIASYRPAVNRIIDYYLNGPFKGQTYKRLAHFVDRFGYRLTGSQALEDSIDFMVEESNKNNMSNVHKEPVIIPKWIRGEEKLTMLKPRMAKMPLLGLGLSVSTPPGGITAKAIVVRSFDDLNALNASEVTGKIVVYDQPFIFYGQSVQYRGWGGLEASKKGAVAALVRSVTPFSIASPHTGLQGYEDGVKRIPAAAISHEDADMMRRMQDRNEEIELRLEMTSSESEAVSYNVVSELQGVEDKYVIVSGHIDSWDAGDGAMDDGGGVMISWLAPIAMKNLNLKLRRTVRTVLFTAEEQGLVGAFSYEERNRNESSKYSYVMESDFGTFSPLGTGYEGSEIGQCAIKEVLKLFDSINTTELSLAVDAGPDVSVWTSQGIPGGGFLNANDKYFWFHHSDGDRMNIEDSDVLDVGGAFWTAYAYVMADMKYEIPRGPPKPLPNLL